MNKRAKTFTKKAVLAVTAPALACALAFSGLPTLLNASASTDAKGHWTSDFATLEEAHEVADELNIQMMAEGMVLLKNGKDANHPVFPLDPARDGITLMGASSYHVVSGGMGSGAGADIKVTLQQSLRDAGFKVNRVMEQTYQDLPVDLYQGYVSAGVRAYKLSTIQEDPDYIKSSAYSIRAGYKTVVWTLSRVGCEGSDAFTSNVPINKDPHKHYLQLTDNEEAMLKYLGELKENGIVEKVVVLIGSANVIEMAPLQDSDIVDGIFWLGQPGPNGLSAVGKLFKGEINPSGKTVDIWDSNHTADPTWYNFGDNSQHNTWVEQGGKWTTTKTYDQFAYANGKADEKTHTLEYEEDIYLGYKWYETACADNVLKDIPKYDTKYSSEDDPNGYYNRGNGVVYPFGFGLSYTTFSQEILTTQEELAAAIKTKAKNGAANLDETVEMQVKVTNTGKVAGKEVVELYVNPPYTKGTTKLEKAYVQLVSFAKTGLLQPDSSETVTLRIRLADIAAFDYKDANANSYKGYEIEAGTYNFRIQKNSHELADGNKNTLAVALDAIKLDNDENAANNTPFSNNDDFDTLLITSEYGKEKGSKATMKLLSRSDFVGTFPTVPEATDRDYGTYINNLLHSGGDTDTAGQNQGDLAWRRYSENMNSSDDLQTDPWYKTNADIPDSWTQAADESGRTNGKTAVQLYQMTGLEMDSDELLKEGDPFYKAGERRTQKDAWVLFMNQLTYDEMRNLISNAGYQTQGLASVGKNRAEDADGPAQLGKSKGGYTFCCEVNISSTWNVNLAYARGYLTGHDSLFLNIPGWYGPAMNTHRSPFGGRNFEYYSQDGVQGGFIAAADVAGFQRMGGYSYIKHFALNDQETNRGCLGTWTSEQNARENYFKVFEYAIKEFDQDINVTIGDFTLTGEKVGGSLGIMTGGNRIGAIDGYINHRTQQTLARDEWGFKGQVVTDSYSGGNGKANILIRSGGNLPLGSYKGLNSISGEWDATLRNGKGGVRDGNAGTDGKMPESATQWYWVRTATMQVLYVGANTNVCKNGVDESVFTNMELTITEGDKLDVNLSDSLKSLGSTVTYAQIGDLPEGVTLTNAGYLSGRPVHVGEYTIKVSMKTQMWITAEATITLKVTPLLSSTDVKDGKLTAKVGEAFSTTFVQKIYNMNDMFDDSYHAFKDDVGRINKIEFSLVTPVAGLKIDKDTGVLSGTPTEGGTHEIVVRTSIGFLSDRRKQMTSSFDTTFTLEIEGESTTPGGQDAPAVEPQFRVNNGKLEYSVDNGSSWQIFEQAAAAGKSVDKFEIKDGHLIVTYSDKTTADLGNVVGPQGPAGQNGTNGTNGADGKSGCGGVIGIGAASMALVTLLGGAAIVLRKKHD